MLRSLLHHFEKVSAVLVIPHQMSAVNNENQRPVAFLPFSESHLFELVKRPLDVEKSRGVAGTLDAEKAADVTVESV